MRPVPHSRHLAAVLIFAVVSAACGYFALLDENPSGTQIELATGALKRHQPDLYQQDYVFGDNDVWRVHSPAAYGVLDLVLIPTKYRDPILPFRMITTVAVMLYLCAVYPLLYRQCRSWSVSAFVAVLSTTVTFGPGGSYWGVGPLGSITPRAACMIAVPLVMLAYLRYQDQPRLPLVFAFVGLMGNLHLVTAMNLTIVLLGIYLGTGRFSLRRWPMAIACGMVSVLAASPYCLYYLALRSGQGPAETEMTRQIVTEALRGQEVLYPSILPSMLYWLLLAGMLAVPSGVVLLRVERFRVRDANVWIWFVIVGVTTAFGLHGLSQLVGWTLGSPPPIIDLCQAASLVMLPLYVLLAQAITNLFRVIRDYRHLLRWACAALMALWMVPSDNFRVARYALYDTATMFMAEESKHLSLRTIHAKHHERVELAAIADWARVSRDAKEAYGTMFIVDRSEFRMMSRRPIVAAKDDVRYVYYLAPSLLKDWTWRYETQKGLLNRPDARGFQEFVENLVQRGLTGVSRWYVILPASAAAAKSEGLKEVFSTQWGTYLKVYELERPVISVETRPATEPGEVLEVPP